ncbi:MAG TPA: ABC transporter substrate-binding protein [Patescibacteria group bacterium]|nr:ABC transporter substrate-binding protein [Patescibacteria group bacterium]
MTRTISRPIAILAALAILLAACSGTTSGGPSGSAATGAKAVYGGSVTFAMNSDISNMDPMLSGLFVDRHLMYAMYDSLVRVTPKGDIIPWLATKWSVSADGKSYTFNLRTDVKYHDGTQFDAASAKWNLDRYRLTKESLRLGELAPIDTVTVVDPYTLKVDLKTPSAPFLSVLVDRSGMMLSQKTVEAGGADFTRKAFNAGSGPFILTEAVKDDHYTFKKNPNWWGTAPNGDKLPYLDQVIIKPITDGDVRLTNVRTGQVQATNAVTGKDVPTVKSDSSLVYQEIAGIGYNSLVPNRAPGFIFNEKRYVQAVSYAMDRDELLNKGPAQGVGVVGYGQIAPSHFAFDPNFKPFAKPDIAKAKQLVADVGKGPLKFELLVSSGDAATLQFAQLLQSELAKADITMDIKTLLFNDIVALQQKHQQSGATLIGWSGRIDPDGNVYDFNYTGRPNNDSAYSNKQVDTLLDQTRTETDQAKRKALYQQVQQITMVDDPSRIVYSFNAAQLLTAKAVQGFNVFPDQLPRFETVWLQK